MTKKGKIILKKGMEGSIERQSRLFNESFLTRFLYKQAVKRGRTIKY